MDRAASGLNFFSFIGERHPFFPQMEAFRLALRESPRYAELLELSGQSGGEVHAEIKALRSETGSWRLDRFYWCFQYEEAGAKVPFRSHTVYFRADRGGPELYDFPVDPYLTTMDRWFRQLLSRGADAPEVDVLRYVPLRRLTFRIRTPGAGPVIGKFKRRSKLVESAERLQTVHRAAACASFRVAAPGMVDGAENIYYQEALPGTSLASLLSVDSAEVLLRQAGAVHAELHRLAVPGLAEDSPGEDAAALVDDIRWIAFVRPELRGELEALIGLLAATCPAPRADAFLHGDFVPSQLLVHPERWSVTDFDLAHRGDAAHEMAAFLASLKYDVPALAEAFERGGPEAEGLLARAEAAYLAGYEARADDRVDVRSLAWHRVAVELHYIALMFKKDWYRPARFERALALTRTLAGELRGQR